MVKRRKRKWQNGKTYERTSRLLTDIAHPLDMKCMSPTALFRQCQDYSRKALPIPTTAFGTTNEENLNCPIPRYVMKCITPGGQFRTNS